MRAETSSNVKCFNNLHKFYLFFFLDLATIQPRAIERFENRERERGGECSFCVLAWTATGQAGVK